MFNPTDLFKQRLTEHIKLLNRYLRYIFNGHFMIALLFIVVTLAVYYQQLLERLNENFPATFVIALILGLLVSYNPIQSFLKEPDKVFFNRERARNVSLFSVYISLYVYCAALHCFPRRCGN